MVLVLPSVEKDQQAAISLDLGRNGDFGK